MQSYISDPTFAEVVGRYHKWCACKKPLNWFLIAQERERATAIGDQNTLRIIRELIAHEPTWRNA